jgi:hypothetical protein
MEGLPQLAILLREIYIKETITIQKQKTPGNTV